MHVTTPPVPDHPSSFRPTWAEGPSLGAHAWRHVRLQMQGIHSRSQSGSTYRMQMQLRTLLILFFFWLLRGHSFTSMLQSDAGLDLVALAGLDLVALAGLAQWFVPLRVQSNYYQNVIDTSHMCFILGSSSWIFWKAAAWKVLHIQCHILWWWLSLKYVAVLINTQPRTCNLEVLWLN
jgi:hypothetical protein